MKPIELRGSTMICTLGKDQVRAGRPTAPDSALSRPADRLLTLVGPGEGSLVAVRVPCVIGRSDRTDLTLTDLGVSRWHARVERQAAGYLIRDLGSVNGTFVNGRRVQVASLEDGDVIRVGHVAIVFRAARRSA